MERRLDRFLSGPDSIRNALGVITAGTTTIMFVAALAMRIVDAKEYPNFGRALWWAVQTQTTVGYGDVAPKEWTGRLVAALLMIWGVAFIAILTAVITSTFIAGRTRESGLDRATIQHLTDRFDRIEALLGVRED